MSCTVVSEHALALGNLCVQKKIGILCGIVRNSYEIIYIILEVSYKVKLQSTLHLLTPDPHKNEIGG